MKNIKIGVWLLIGLISSAVQAQNTNLMLWEENLEQLATEAESTDWEDELEELSHRLTQKLNLNTATRQQLEIFPFLSDIQVENLLAYVYIHGDMQTLYELQLVEEMDKATIERLLPFVCVVSMCLSIRAKDMRQAIWDLRSTIRYVTISVIATVCKWA